jgi:hypothetical protein
MKKEYYVEIYIDGWLRILTESREYCQGYFDAKKVFSPRLAMRLIRSDGQIIEELTAKDDVSIGQIAGWPTAEQYEAAGKRAFDRAKVIRATKRRGGPDC